MASAPDKPTREQLEADWWKRWWAYDYSWEGLARKRIDGAGGLHGEKTLQEYWRRDPANPTVIRDDAAMEAAGELIRAPDGALWHLAHVPLAWKDGSPAKSAWNDTRTSRLRDLVTARLMAGAETKGDKEKWWQMSGPDGRAQLRGAVFGADGIRLPTREFFSTIHLDCTQAWLTGLDATNRGFGHIASFNSATFSGNARFDRATFSGTASFGSATFSGTAWFDSATFSGTAWFNRATFSRNANFGSATFTGSASFGSATFSGTAWFDRATFKSGVSFFNSRFFAIARFTEVTWPAEARHWDRAFDAAIFAAPVSFRGGKRLGQNTNDSFIPHAAFDGASFDRAPAFDVVTESASDRNFNVSLEGAKQASKSDADEWAQREFDRVKKKPPQASAGTSNKVPSQVAIETNQDLRPLRRGPHERFRDLPEFMSDADGRIDASLDTWGRDSFRAVEFKRTRLPRHPWFETGVLGALADWQENVEIRSGRDTEYERRELEYLASLGHELINGIPK